VTDLLQRIVADKRAEVEALKVAHPLESFRDSLDPGSVWDFRAAVSAAGRTNIIAEIKRGSPAKGMLSRVFNPVVLAAQYQQGGAAALSVLTERRHFFGHYEFVRLAGKRAGLPVLCKDFIFDQYQIYHARWIGADAILLIARLLAPDQLAEFISRARAVGLAALVEVHNRAEVRAALDSGAELLGVNSRDLSDFTVRLETAEELAPLIPAAVIKIAESGIRAREDVRRLERAGYRAFLIGEALVTSSNPAALLQELRGV